MLCTSFIDGAKKVYWKGQAVIRVSTTMRYTLSQIILAETEKKAIVIFEKWILKTYPTATYNKQDTNTFKVRRLYDKDILK